MANGYIAVVRPRAHVKKHSPTTAATPRRRLLAEWSRVLALAAGDIDEEAFRDWVAGHSYQV